MKMIERVARALAQSDGFHPSAKSNDEDSQEAWTLYEDMAKDGIKAMIDPTESILDAGYEASVANGDYAEEGEFIPRMNADVWREMVKAALNA